MTRTTLVTAIFLTAGALAATCLPCSAARVAQPAGDQAAARQDTSADQTALIVLEHQWAQALVTRDIKALVRIMADDFMDIGYTGGVSLKVEILKGIEANRGPRRLNHLEGLKARVYGPAAVVTGMNVVTDADGNFLRRIRFTDTFVKLDGGWRAVSGHESAVLTP